MPICIIFHHVGGCYARMVDTTHWTCFVGAIGVGGLGWFLVGTLTFLGLVHIMDATVACSSQSNDVKHTSFKGRFSVSR